LAAQLVSLCCSYYSTIVSKMQYEIKLLFGQKKQLPIMPGAEIVRIKTELDTAEYNIL